MVRNRGGCAHVVRERAKHARREDYVLDRLDCRRSRFRLADLVFSPEKIVSDNVYQALSGQGEGLLTVCP
jgi:hypothetical protein